MIHWFKQRVWPLLSRTVSEWNGDDGGLLAASLAFYTAFSFFPLLLVLLSIAGFVLRVSPELQQKQNDLIAELANVTSPQLADWLAEIMGQIQSSAAVGGPLGIATLFLAAIGIFANMEVAFARIWKKHDLPSEHKGWLHTIWQVLFVRLKAFLVVLILGLFIVVTFFTGIVLSGIRKFIAERVSDYPSLAEYVGDIVLNESLWYWLQFGVGFGLNVIFFTITYRLFSLRRTSWWECMKGGLLAGFLWELGRYALTLYLLRGGYSAYGVIGSFIGIMLWFYYAWTVLFFGAEFVQVSHRIRVARQAAHSAAEKPAPAQPSPEKQN